MERECGEMERWSLGEWDEWNMYSWFRVLGDARHCSSVGYCLGNAATRSYHHVGGEVGEGSNLGRG